MHSSLHDIKTTRQKGGETRPKKGDNMKAYGIDYTVNGHHYSTTVAARDRDSARNKIGRKHRLNAAESKKAVKLTRVVVLGYF